MKSMSGNPSNIGPILIQLKVFLDMVPSSPTVAQWMFSCRIEMRVTEKNPPLKKCCQGWGWVAVRAC